jgi:hypothetical protein
VTSTHGNGAHHAGPAGPGPHSPRSSGGQARDPGMAGPMPLAAAGGAVGALARAQVVSVGSGLPRGRRAAAWWPARRRLALMAVATAALTAAAVAALGASDTHALAAGLYMLVAVAAVFLPDAIPVQVIGGQLLAASLLVGGSVDLLLLLPVVAGVVATAELLAVVGRMDAPGERDPRADVRRAGGATGLAAAVFGAVALVGRVPGPTGLLAVVLASAACAGLAIVLARSVR